MHLAIDDAVRVFGAHHEPLSARAAQAKGDVGHERRVTAFVLHGGHVVDPYARVIVDGAEVQHHPIAAPPDALDVGNLEFSRVPNGAMKAGVADAAAFA